MTWLAESGMLECSDPGWVGSPASRWGGTMTNDDFRRRNHDGTFDGRRTTINRRPSTGQHQQTNINRPTSIDQHQSTTINRPPSIDHHQSTTINRPPSIDRHQKTITLTIESRLTTAALKPRWSQFLEPAAEQVAAFFHLRAADVLGRCGPSKNPLAESPQRLHLSFEQASSVCPALQVKQKTRFSFPFSDWAVDCLVRCRWRSACLTCFSLGGVWFCLSGLILGSFFFGLAWTVEFVWFGLGVVWSGMLNVAEGVTTALSVHQTNRQRPERKGPSRLAWGLTFFCINQISLQPPETFDFGLT
ncbi:hypothetical protein IWZ01DRAFT_98928 [Phyllosticta capitalensis]